MFSLFKSESKKLRETAKNWLYHAGKVYHFRKDRLSETEVSTLLRLSEEVKSGMRDKSESADSRLRASIESLKEHMEHVGGNYYPRGSMAENVEFFFAALIIYVGFTTFFIKPFKIPTNSMWPSYYGMTGEVYADDAEKPNVIERAFRFVSFGAKHYDVTAPTSGELLIPMVKTGSGSYRIFERPANVKRYFVINAPGAERVLYVGDESVSFKYPSDFNLDRQVLLPLQKAGVVSPYDRLIERGGLSQGSFAGTKKETIYDPRTGRNMNVTVYLLRTGRMVEEGESLLSFDLMTGDQLFVDRMSYHFVSPKVGDGFVFKTDSIPAVAEDKFYIKRLVGTPGDTVKVEGSTLYVNGEPATGSVAFEKNSKMEDNYGGYTTMKDERSLTVDLSTEQTVPDGHFFAIGDNSHNSSDGRVWGYVPPEAVVGRPVMIYYPFTKRFGLAK
ncbi:signal peptidase I [Pelagicoccus sp. SDUM812002]|uniref:signal peptidase I n=1 Tax=Pelagicoccus sp. SDUM812002 TaxID=3041266 RepID=UPI00280EED2E|nr:signal peptidase I [Pelagicoccus sp. SDUM812002]MDQ8185364.1 signal peptidase I [Pelagicoccus sp. SDUM812002]